MFDRTQLSQMCLVYTFFCIKTSTESGTGFIVSNIQRKLFCASGPSHIVTSRIHCAGVCASMDYFEACSAFLYDPELGDCSCGTYFCQESGFETNLTPVKIYVNTVCPYLGTFNISLFINNFPS